MREVVDLAQVTNAKLPESFVFVGGHSAGFVAGDIPRPGDGAMNCLVKGTREAAVATRLLAGEPDHKAARGVPGVVDQEGKGRRSWGAEELVTTLQGGPMEHVGWKVSKRTIRMAADHLRRGRTNFVPILWKFSSIYNPLRQPAAHHQPVRYEMALPPPRRDLTDAKVASIHGARGPQGRARDDSTERFVEATRMGTPASPAGDKLLWQSREAVRDRRRGGIGAWV